MSYDPETGEVHARVGHNSGAIDDDRALAALEWIKDNAARMGKARGEAIRAERMLKHVKALLMKKHSGAPVSVQEREALLSERYLQAIDDEANAVAEDVTLRALKDYHDGIYEAWRTLSANRRNHVNKI